MRSNTSGWILDLVFGGIGGGVVGVVAAVNVVIYAGIEDGYEATIGEVFSQNSAIGVVVVAIVLLGPALGIVLARFVRKRRATASRTSDGRG